MFGLSSLAAQLLGAVAILAIGFGGGFYTEYRFADDAAKSLALAQANATTKEIKHEVAVAQSEGAAGQALADQAAGAFQNQQTQIQTVTKTLIQKIPTFIAPNPVQSAQEAQGGQSNESGPIVIYGVPNGLRLLHDAAAAGISDIASIPGTAGLDLNAPSDVDMSRFGSVLAENYGACHEAINRAGADEAYILQLKFWYADLVQKLSKP